MRVIPLALALISLSILPAQKAQRAQSLFDGATPDGWLEVTGRPFPTTSWTIEDGCLKAFPNPDGNQDIRTAGTFASFDFSFEWKIARGGKSGVKYLVQQTDRWQRKGEKGFSARARGLEYQLTDDEINDDALSGPARATAALYNIFPPLKPMPARAGVFHRSRIRVDGDRVEHWLDGAKVLEFNLSGTKVSAALANLATRNGKEPATRVRRESFISLQNHNSEIWFRKLEIRRLD